LKVLLPLVALGLLSTLFLLARSTDPDLAIRYADVDVAALSQDEQVTGPAYSGMTREQAAIRVEADTVRPRDTEPDRLDARTVSGQMVFASGTSARMTAPAAVFDTEQDVARFEGGVTIVSSDGYTFETESLRAALGFTEIVAESEVRATGPLGTLDAASMEISEDEAGGYVVVFNGGVRLLYDPMQTRE
jgi:lipopolysaccharide export system protein LptC